MVCHENVRVRPSAGNNMKGVEKVLKKTLSLVSPATVGIISDQLNFESRASGDASDRIKFGSTRPAKIK